MPIISNFPGDSVDKELINGKQEKITANGVLRGDGAGNVTAAEEAEVTLVELTASKENGVTTIKLGDADFATINDGFSPTVSIVPVAVAPGKPGKQSIFITDAQGQHSFTVTDGADGTPGVNGKKGTHGDSVSATVSDLATTEEKPAGGVSVSIETTTYLENGTSSASTSMFNIYNGTTAYQSAKKGGYSGTETEFNAALSIVDTKANKPRVLNLTLSTASWTGEDPYTQTVTIANGTENTKCDLTMNDTVYTQLCEDGVGYLIIENDGGVFTAKAKGAQPSADIDIQVTCTEIVPPPTLAVKGQLLNMNLDGTGDKQYRVLSMNGNIAKVLGMDDISTSQVYNATDKTGAFAGGTTGQLYADSDLDTYLNTTWYNTLSNTAKAAIRPESRTQGMYQHYTSPSTPNTPTYTYQYQYNWQDSEYRNADLTDSVLVGNRNVFALDLKDIYDYFGKVCITSNELMEMWTNQTSAVSDKHWGLMSTYKAGGSGGTSGGGGSASGVWTVNGVYGYLTSVGAAISCAVRPAFNIDLSKITFTEVSA